MNKSIFQKYFKQKKVVCLEWLVDSTGIERLSFVELEEKHNKIYCIRGEYGKSNLEDILNLIPKDIPLILNITGKGVLHRGIQLFKDQQHPAKLLFPNTNLDSFYVQHYQVLGKPYISIIRKQYVDDLIVRVEKEMYTVSGVTIGSFQVLELINTIEIERDEEIEIANHNFNWDPETQAYLHKVSMNKKEHKHHVLEIKGQNISVFLLAQYGAGCNYLTGRKDFFLHIKHVELKLKELKYKGIFKKSIVTGFILFFLIGIPLVIQFYNYRNTLNSYTLHQPENLKLQIDSLQSHLVYTKNVLKGLLRDQESNFRMSYLTDRILSCMPIQIQLSSFEVFPKDLTMSRKNQKPFHDHDRITIVGKSKNINLVQTWINDVEKLSFCSKAEILTFKYDERTETGNFQINVWISI